MFEVIVKESFLLKLWGRLSKKVLFTILPLVFLSGNASGQDFTAEELQFIKDHPVIIATNQPDWGPLDLVDQGKPTGFSVEYLNLIASKVGLKIEYVQDKSWSENLEMLKNREIDVAHSISIMDERKEYLNFTDPYLELQGVYIGRQGTEHIDEYDDLLDKRIAAIRPWPSSATYREKYPELDVIEFENVREALTAISIGEADLFSGSISPTNYTMKKYFITGLATVGQEFLEGKNQYDALYIAARNDWPELISLLNKGMAAVTEDEFISISEKWLSEYQTPIDIGLTDEEKEWLANNKLIKVAVEPFTEPYEFINEKGEMSGISSSYLREISNLLGVEFVWSGNENWDQAFDHIKSGKADMLSSVSNTPERAEYLSFTDTYLTLFHVIFGREGGQKFSNAATLNGYKIAQMRGSIVTALIRENYPNIEIVEADNIIDVLKLVSSGEVDAYIGDVPTTASYISSTGLSNVIVVGATEISTSAGMGIRSDLPLLASAVSKALNAITDAKRSEITAEWHTVKVETVDSFEAILQVVLIASVIIIVISIWAISLRREIRRREVVEEELMEAMQSAESASHAKSAFLANMSHELRTPLNAIVGFSDVIDKEVFGKIKNEKYRDYISNINTSGKYLEDIITDILDLSKIEAGKWELIEKKFPVVDCVIESREMIDVLADNKNITVECDFDVDEGLEVFGDENAFKRIFINLFSNAVKFTEQNGEIKCHMSLLKSGNLKIEVADNGVGIPKEKLKDVVTPFSQAHDRRNTKERGTGLGLPIVKQFCELHDGEFKLISKVGIGTKAIIMIPAERVKYSSQSELRMAE